MKNTLIRSVIFDFDGLIMDTEYPIFQSWQELFHSHGGRLETSDWVHYVGTMDNERDFVEELEVQIGRKLDRKKLNDARWQRETELIAAQPLLPGGGNFAEGGGYHPPTPLFLCPCRSHPFG